MGGDIPRRDLGHPTVGIWRNTAGSDRYTSQFHQEINLTQGDFSPDGVLQYNLNPPISFESRDVLGVYQPDQFSSDFKLFYYNNNSAPVTFFSNTRHASISLSSLSPLERQVTLITPVTSEFIHSVSLFFSTIAGPSSCSEAFLSPTDLRQTILEENINGVEFNSNEQRLFPEIIFTCNGSITKWIVGGEPSNNGQQQPELQIW